MKMIDVSREWLSSPMYPGDPAPRLEPLTRMAYGDVCNTSAVCACLHTGTHMDVPLHVFSDGTDAAAVLPERCAGECTVVSGSGLVTGEQAERLLQHVHTKKLLLKGAAAVSTAAAFVLCDEGLELIGVEGTSVAPPEEEMPVHRQLLDSGMLILEGLDLSAVTDGVYYLMALPLKIAGADGSPVRAVLLERNYI